MAQRAGRRQVRACQGPARSAVIKLPVHPRHCVMARRALCLRETRRDVIRYVAAQRLRAIPIRQVAADARRVRAGQCVIVVYVAQRASRCQMRARQREAGVRVVECRSGPSGCVVARRTLRCWEACRNVVRNRASQGLCAGPRRLVASVAIRVRRRERIVVVHMAVRAGHYFARRRQLMRTGQRPSRGAVIKRRCRPGDRVVACRAIRRGKWCPRACVCRIIRRLPGRKMAAGIPAVRRLNGQRVVIVNVALRTCRHFSCRRHLVRIRQREARCAVIKLPIQPSDHVVARRAL